MMNAKELREFRITNKLCTKCGEPAVFLGTMCEKHRAAKADAMSKSRAAKRDKKIRRLVYVSLHSGSTLKGIDGILACKPKVWAVQHGTR